MALITRSTAPNAKGSKLSFNEMDNNLYYLQSIGYTGITYSANTVTLTNPTGGTISTQINNEYNKYVALLTQTSSNEPTAIVLENNLGNITYTYDSVGFYKMSGDTLFTEDKTVIFNTQMSSSGAANIQIFRNNDNELYIFTALFTSGDFYANDDVLSNTAIEIRVYN